MTLNATGCGFEKIFDIFIFSALVSRQNATLSSATQHAIPSEFAGQWGTECLIISFSIPTYSVSLKKNKKKNKIILKLNTSHTDNYYNKKVKVQARANTP